MNPDRQPRAGYKTKKAYKGFRSRLLLRKKQKETSDPEKKDASDPGKKNTSDPKIKDRSDWAPAQWGRKRRRLRRAQRMKFAAAASAAHEALEILATRAGQAAPPRGQSNTPGRPESARVQRLHARSRAV